MSLRKSIENNLNKILDFRINQVLSPVVKKSGALPIAGVVLLTAFTSISASAANNPYPAMNNASKKIPSVFTPKSVSSQEASSENKGNGLSSMYGSRSQTADPEKAAKKAQQQLQALAKKGLDVINPACATATYKMIIDSENASKFSTREKIMAANFIQPFIANSNDSLLIKYASAIDNAQSDYIYNWKNFRRDANNQSKSLRTDPYERSFENSIEKTTNEGAKAIFQSIGFNDTSEKLQKRIDRIEKREAQAEQRKINAELSELDREVSFILTNVADQLKSGKLNMDFTKEEARAQNQELYNQIVDLIQPGQESLKQVQMACETPQMTRI